MSTHRQIMTNHRQGMTIMIFSWHIVGQNHDIIYENPSKARWNDWAKRGSKAAGGFGALQTPNPPNGVQGQSTEKLRIFRYSRCFDISFPAIHIVWIKILYLEIFVIMKFHDVYVKLHILHDVFMTFCQIHDESWRSWQSWQSGHLVTEYP